MFNIERREQTIRARACDIAELFYLAKRADTDPSEVETTLSNVLTSALFASRCYERTLSGDRLAEPSHSANKLESDELLDRMKGIIEFEVPFLLLLTRQNREECRQQVKTIIERQIERDSQIRLLIPGLTEVNAPRVGETETTRDLVAWALAALDGVFQARQHIDERNQVHAPETDAGQ